MSGKETRGEKRREKDMSGNQERCKDMRREETRR